MINVKTEYATYIQKASDTLYIMLDGQKKTHSEVITTAEMLLPIATGVANIKSNPYYADILSAVVDRYEIEVGIKTYSPDTIAKDKQSKYWLYKIKPAIPHPFFDRYKQYLRSDGFAMKAIDSYKGRQELIEYTKFAEFTLTKEDAVRYLYADSTKHRVHRWKDIKVSLYI